MNLPSVLVGIIGFIIELFVAVPPVFSAISVSVTNVPASVDQSQEFGVDVTLTCPNCSSDSYLRGVFYPSGTSYFGFTENNGGDWINAPGGDCTQYFKVGAADLSHEGTWSGSLRVKVDPASPYYSSPGDYLFKVGRYTTSCSTTWSQESTVTVTGPSPTPTNTSTPIPTMTSIPTPTASLTPTVSPTITPIPRFIETPVISQISRPSDEDSSAAATVLGESDDIGSEIRVGSASALTKSLIISTTLVSLGLAILSGVFVWRLREASKKPLE